MAIVDDRYVGTVPIGGPFRKNSEWPVKVELYSYDSCWDTASMVKIHPSVGISELLCFTEDLDDLVRQGRIKRRRANEGAAHAIHADEMANISQSELHRAQRTLAALAIGLSKKHPAYRHGKKPNVSALAELAIDHLRDADGRAPHGFSEKTSRDTISEALKSFPELTEGSGQSN